jgi:DNA (cytosine-5)-methyltransferase 1
MHHANDNHTGLRYLSVCSGIEAATVAWHPLGWRAVAFSEIEKFPSAVLAHHYPDVPNLGDFTKIDVTTLGRVDIIAGGTPCQAFSVAGLRQSLADARGNLSLEYVRLAHELAAHNGLRNAVWENVVGVLSTKDNAFGCFLAGLVGADSAIEPPARGKWGSSGMVSGPKGRAAWRIQDAQYHGLAQRRRRVLVVADFGNGADPAEVLFERQGVQRHSAPSREAGKDVAGTTASGFGSSGDGYWREGIGPLRAREQDSHESLAVYAPEIARCVATREGSSQDYETTTMVAVGVHGDIAHTLKAEGADASEDGTGRGTPVISVVPIDMRQASRGATMTNNRKHGQSGGAPGTGIGEEGDPSPTIGTSHPPAICFSAKDYGADASFELSPTLRSGNHSESHQNGGVMPAIAFDTFNQAVSDVTHTLRVSHGLEGVPATFVSAVRRLTPKECERLQGFPDDYTAIPWRGKPADQCPDGPRYKALGNSWAVPKFAWIGRRIQMLMPAVAANDNHQSVSNAA